MMEYIFMCSASVAYMGDMAETTLNLDHKWAPLLWLVFYAFAIATCATSLRNMWYTSTAIFVVTMSLLLIYVLGSLKYVNMTQYGPYWNNTAMYVPVMGNNNMTYSLDYNTTTVVMQADGTNVTMALGTPLMPTNARDPSYWFVGGISEFMATLALTTWAFAGVECLVLMVDMVKDPKKNIAVGCAGGVGLLMATNIATVPSHPPSQAISLLPFSNSMFPIPINYTPWYRDDLMITNIVLLRDVVHVMGDGLPLLHRQYIPHRSHHILVTHPNNTS